MSYIEEVLKEIYQTKEEYIEECKRCFLKEDEETQEEINNADIETLDYYLKITFNNDLKKAIKYELMLRNDFEIKI